MTKPISRVLANGRLAVLSRTFMEQYVRRHLSTWFPGMHLVRLTIASVSPLDFKKSIAYTLTLRRSPRQPTQTRTLRANIPSLDTTQEAVVADSAMRAIWSRNLHRTVLLITRPLGYDTALRALFYEELPGRPLASHLRHRREDVLDRVADAATWLSTFHVSAIPSGRRRSLARERLETHYFSLNYERNAPSIVPVTRRILDRYMALRTTLDPAIQRSSVLTHGDYNPNNVVIDEQTNALGVIDFGYAKRFDPMSDYANAVVQLELFHWIWGLDLPYVRQVVRTFTKTYTQGRSLGRDERRRFALFSTWWKMQVLSYTLSIATTFPHDAKQRFIRDTLRTASTSLARV